jgi:hypothetical protein
VLCSLGSGAWALEPVLCHMQLGVYCTVH